MCLLAAGPQQVIGKLARLGIGELRIISGRPETGIAIDAEGGEAGNLVVRPSQSNLGVQITVERGTAIREQSIV